MDLTKNITKSKILIDILFPLFTSIAGYVAWWIVSRFYIDKTFEDMTALIPAAIVLFVILSGALILLYKMANYYNKGFGLNYKSFFIHNLIISYIFTASITYIITSEFIKENFNILKSILFPLFYWYFLIFTIISFGLLYYFFYVSKKQINFFSCPFFLYFFNFVLNTSPFADFSERNFPTLRNLQEKVINFKNQKPVEIRDAQKFF